MAFHGVEDFLAIAGNDKKLFPVGHVFKGIEGLLGFGGILPQRL